MLTYTIPEKHPEGRRLAISDIHGCCQTFRKLLEKIHLQPSDQLFLLGDYVHRGPDSKGVLDHILQLIEEGYGVFCLRGNHEEMLLEDMENIAYGNSDYYLSRHNLSGLLNEKADGMSTKYRNFLEKLPYYFKLEDYYLVHAGFDFSSAKPPLENYEEMCWIRDFRPPREFLQGRKIIHGHTPMNLDYIRQDIALETSVIPIDNGCAYTHRKNEIYKQGNLVCLNLDDLSLTIQENIDSGEFS